MKFALDPGAYAPEKTHLADAGWDLKTPYPCAVSKFAPAVIKTGVHVSIPEGYVGLIKTKSGLNVKHGIQCDGVIDAGYTGEIVVKLYTASNDPHEFERGDKISQLVIVPVSVDTMEKVSLDELKEEAAQVSLRGTGGFGSTGK